MLRTVISIALAVVVLSACRGDDDGHRASSNAPSTSTSVGVDRTEHDLAAARWDAAGIASYRYVSTGNCECNLGGRLDVTVVDGQVTTLLRADVEGAPALDPEVGVTIDGMFEMIAGVEPGIEITAEYDETLGYPKYFELVLSPGATDGTVEVMMESFEATT